MLPVYLYDIQGVNSIYTPTPTIIEAAQALYMGHSVEDISRNDVSEKNKSNYKEEGRITPVDEVHLIVPVSQGGTNDESNLMSLCKSCNNKIHIEIGDR